MKHATQDKADHDLQPPLAAVWSYATGSFFSSCCHNPYIPWYSLLVVQYTRYRSRCGASTTLLLDCVTLDSSVGIFRGDARGATTTTAVTALGRGF